MTFRAILFLLVTLVVAFVATAAEPSTQPASVDITKMDVAGLRTLARALMAENASLQAQVSELKQQVGLSDAPSAPVASASPTTRGALATSWVIKITGKAAMDTRGKEAERVELNKSLTGGAGGAADRGVQGAFAQDQAQNQSSGRGFRGTGSGRSNYQQQSGNINGGPAGGSFGMAIAEGLNSQLSKESLKLTNMQSAMRDDGRGSRVNVYPTQAIMDQKTKVARLQTQIDDTNRKIIRLTKEIETALNNTDITGVTDDGKIVIVHANAPQVMPELVRTLEVGQKIHVEGAPSRRVPIIEVTARSVVPL